jgi:hypothetical protein
MLMSLSKQVLRSPVKLFLLCLVLFMAAQSFFVALVLGLLVVGYVKGLIRQQAKDAMAKAKAEEPVAATPAQQAPAATRTVEPQSQREYAKSAVVIPFRSGTRG